MLSQAQTEGYFWESKAEIEVGLLFNSPLDNFQRAVDQNFVGVGTSFLFRQRSSPSIMIGMDMSYSSFSRLRANYFLEYDGYLDEYNVRTGTNVIGLHGKIRIAPSGYRKWTPFAEGMIGTKFLGTRSNIYSNFDGESEQFDGYWQETDWALSYGGALGLIRNLSTYDDMDINVHLKVAYLPGGGADFLTLAEDYIIGTLPEDPYTEKFSTTNLLQLQIGVTFAFGKEEPLPAYE